jgi:hypothetical protein
MKKPRKSKKPKLPPPPTGFELLDMQWSAIAPRAEAYLALLPPSADESWGTEEGMLAFIYALHDVNVARAELDRTLGLTLVRLRQRELRKNELTLSDCTALIISVLARSARRQHPSALPSQLLLLIRDRVRALIGRALRGLALLDSFRLAEGSE